MDIRDMIARIADETTAHSSTIRAFGIGFLGAFVGVLMAATMLLGAIERRLDFLSFEAARHGTALYLSNAYEVTGPSGLGRVLVIPNDPGAALGVAECPAWAGDEATCLILRNVRGD